jgi:hypothetical protein
MGKTKAHIKRKQKKLRRTNSRPLLLLSTSTHLKIKQLHFIDASFAANPKIIALKKKQISAKYNKFSNGVVRM